MKRGNKSGAKKATAAGTKNSKSPRGKTGYAPVVGKHIPLTGKESK